MRGPPEGTAPGLATQVRCRHCADRVLLIHPDRSQARVAMAIHLDQKHQVGNIILEGKDFLCEPAPHRCDLCCSLVEPPYWIYTTVNGADYTAEDPEWAICQDCHESLQILEHPLPVLTQRAFRAQREAFVLDHLDDQELTETLVESLRGFLDHRADAEPVQG